MESKEPLPPSYADSQNQPQYPPTQAEYPPAQGQYPPAQGQYPPMQGNYPPPQGQYPPQQPPPGAYPEKQGQYPPQQPGGYYPPPTMMQNTNNTTVVTVQAQPAPQVHCVAVDNHSGLAWFSCLCCCWPIGIAAIVKSNEVNNAIAAGDFVRAQRASADARKYAIIAIIIGLIAVPTIIVINVLRASSA
ncbi:calcium-binding protein P-like [Hydractinia symbiolongicarpus]|uniref:calcium-binding protein P-like n=1 Tax=Hydractinia symbiolongicarpus TaxID=13093 RepID=UPI00254F57E4|nr:calcium-binding protein P-like [Hydractinia symbiolongicarpus]